MHAWSCSVTGEVSSHIFRQSTIMLTTFGVQLSILEDKKHPTYYLGLTPEQLAFYLGTIFASLRSNFDKSKASCATQIT